MSRTSGRAAAWVLAAVLVVVTGGTASAQEGGEAPSVSSVVAGMPLRGIGPALMSGRIVDIAVDPVKPSTWFVAAGSGGVWKTVNAGTTWSPVFDGQASYSIGCVTI